jgi:hypothetical protein
VSDRVAIQQELAAAVVIDKRRQGREGREPSDDPGIVVRCLSG